jgi:hypothetical protein
MLLFFKNKRSIRASLTDAPKFREENGGVK